MNLRRTIRFLTLLFSASLLGLLGPGGCGSPGNCDTFVVDYCTRVSECDPAVYAFLSGGDDGICQARLRPSCTGALTIDGDGLTQDKAGECGKAVRGLSCDDLFSGHLPAVCTPPGSRADGAACSDEGQCMSTRCTGSATTCGTCVPRLAVGASCQSTDQCQYGLHCKNEGTSSATCAEYVSAGQTCAAGDSCLPSLFCDNGGKASGTCAVRHQVGESCLQNADCDATKKLGCDPTSKKCVGYSVNYVAVGGACTSSTNTSYNICKGDAHCQISVSSGGTQTSSCLAAIPAGQPCTTSGATCTAGYSCTNSVCQSPAAPITCK